MSRPAVFFDRDNTLIANGDYLGDPAGVTLLAGAPEAVARVKRLGFLAVVVSNQSGVARGMFTEEDVRAVNARMDALLVESEPDAVIDHHEFCPHHPDGTVAEYARDHPRRKPQPGMLLDAAESLGIDLARSWLIGDAPRDIEAGCRAGCRTILVRDAVESASPAAAEPLQHDPDYVASSLEDAVDFIEMQLGETRAGPPRPVEAVATPISASRPSAGAIAPQLGALRSAIEETASAGDADKQTLLLLERIVEELRRGNDPPQDFSVARMLGGVVQGFAIALFVAAILFRNEPVTFGVLIGMAIFLQLLVSSLVLMGR